LPVFIGLSKAKEGKNTFDKEWAAKLAESEKGYSFSSKKNCWMNSTTIAITKPADKLK